MPWLGSCSAITPPLLPQPDLPTWLDNDLGNQLMLNVPPHVSLQDKVRDALAKHGGVEGIAAALHTNERQGISTTSPVADQSVEGRQRIFGPNKFREVQQKSFFKLLWENLQDPVLILLMVAALVSAALAAGGP